MPEGQLYTSNVQVLANGSKGLHYYLGTSFTENGQSRVMYNLTATDNTGGNYTGKGYIWLGQLVVTELSQIN